MRKIGILIGCLSIATLSSYASEQESPLEKVISVQKLQDERAKESIGDWMSEKFGLTPYRPNYILPFGYTSHNYKEWTPTDGKYKNVEAEFQVSLKMAFKRDLLGLGEIYYGAYSQRSYWQLYIESAPFRESNYNPELFVTFPLGSKEYFGFKSLTVGYSHVSNGQGNITLTDNTSEYPQLENRSRSLNTLFVQTVFQQKSLILDLRFWARIGNLDDNPDLMDYIGYGRIKAMYFYKKHLFTAMGRFNPFKQKGAFEATYSYPGHLDGVYFFAKIFTGYGESLIDYNTNLTKYSIGFAFSR